MLHFISALPRLLKTKIGTGSWNRFAGQQQICVKPKILRLWSLNHIKQDVCHAQDKIWVKSMTQVNKTKHSIFDHFWQERAPHTVLPACSQLRTLYFPPGLGCNFYLWCFWWRNMSLVVRGVQFDVHTKSDCYVMSADKIERFFF